MRSGHRRARLEGLEQLTRQAETEIALLLAARPLQHVSTAAGVTGLEGRGSRWLMPETALDRAEQLADRLLPARMPKRRMLVIVNPYATTVSDRLKNLVVYALQSRYAVHAVETEKRNHATELCREAASEGYDVVVAFGGDGTVNEAANGLVGTETPLTCLPGGSTNVWCRTLGIPNDVVDATEHLLRMADDFHPFPVDLGRAGERHFVFSSGVGLDASVVRRVDEHPYRKARFGAWYYTTSAVAAFLSEYLVRPPRTRVEVGDRTVEAVTVVVQNSDPFTYFRARPIRLARDAGLDTGSLSLTLLKRATVLELATLIPRIFSARPETVQRHRHVEGFDGLSHARVTALADRPFPLQMDGDYIGEFDQLEYSVSPRAMLAVS
jgi:diacylglycerol kinase family enzyme